MVEMCTYLGIYNLPGRRNVCRTGKRFDPGTATATNAPNGPTQTRLFSSSSLPSLRTTCALLLLLRLFLVAPICALLLLLLHFAHCKSKTTHHPTTPYIDSGPIDIKSRTRRTTKTSGELHLFLILLLLLLLLLRCVVGSSAIFR